MKQRLLGMLVGIGLVFAGAGSTVVPTEAQAQSYRADRAIARSEVRRARAHRAHRAYRVDRALARRDVRRARAHRAYRVDRAVARRDVRQARAHRAYRADRRARAYQRGY